MKYILKNPWLLIIVIPAWILTLLPILFDGQYGCVKNNCGYIIGSNVGDGSWFKAVSAVSFQTFPFQMPNFSGETLRGYHFLPNLATFLLSKIGIPIDFTFHKIIPILYLLLKTSLVVKIGRIIHNSKIFVGILLIFFFFGMQLTLFTSLYHFGEIKNGILINTFQSTRILESPHFALALCGLLYVIGKLYKDKTNLNELLKISLVVFLIVGTKFYVAFSLIIILFVHGVVDYLKLKNLKFLLLRSFLYLTAFTVGIVLFYDPFKTTSSGSIFIFSPLTTTKHLIESPDLFYSENLVLARYFLESTGIGPRLLAIYIYSALLFFVFYFGCRIFGFLYFFNLNNLKKLKSAEWGIITSVIFSMVFSIMFIQKGDWFNPIQFAVPAAFLLNIFLAKYIYELFKSQRVIGIVVFIILLFITLPANFVNLFYLKSTSRSLITINEMNALEELKKQVFGNVFVPISNNDTAYVSAYTNKPTYLNYANAASNAGIDYSERYKIATESKIDISKINTDYYYFPNWYTKEKNLNTCQQLELETVFEKNGFLVCKNQKKRN